MSERTLACPEHVIREHTPLARMIAAQYFAGGLEHDDLVQEGLIGLCKAHRAWRPGGASFRNFAAQCIERQIQTAVIAANRRKHLPLSTAVAFETPVGDDGGTVQDLIAAPERTQPDAQVIAIETFRRQRDIVLRSTHAERAAVAKVLNGGHIDDKQTDNALQRVREKLRRAA